MKITCESCNAQYDLDESRIPPSGVQMKCPACLHQFLVKKPGAGAAAPPPPKPAAREIELSSMDMEEDPGPDLPAPKMPKTSPSRLVDEIDLPAPKAASGAFKPQPLAATKRPPPPPVSKPAPDELPLSMPSISLADEVPDLPAPVTTRTPPLGLTEEPDLPAPRSARPPAAPAHDDMIDLPAPTAPKVAGGPPPMPGLDLPAPKRAPSIGLDLDAPEADDADLVAPRGAPPSLALDVPAIDLESVDVLAPKGEEMGIAPKGDEMGIAPKGDEMGIAPKGDEMGIAPKGEEMNVAPKSEMGLAPKYLPHADHSLDDPTPLEPIKTDEPAGKAAKKKPASDAAAAPARRRMRALVAVVAVLLVVGGVGVGLGVFTSQGYFGANLFSGKKQETAAKIAAARKLLVDDTLASYKKAALDLKLVGEADPKEVEAAALEAEARLAQAWLGVSAESRTADAVLARIEPPKEPVSELARAQALKLVVAGKLAEARQKLNALLASAPADAVALTYLGWTELKAGDWAAAQQAFAKAVQAEPGRAASLYGGGVAKERLGDAAGALELYERALQRSPMHFGAAVGKARLAAEKSGAQQAIEELIAKRSGATGPRELADAWASVGRLAAEAGRRDEAEDRCKRALGLDPDSALARVWLSRVQCDAGKCADGVKPLQKIVADQPKNLDARLGLVRAYVETNQAKDAAGALQPAVQQAPKDARVLYWQGRVAVGDRNDREKALGFYKDAIAADPRYIAAYLAESWTFAALGKNEDALDALKQAEAKASDDPQLLIELGQAYLSLSRFADAEARFRAALAIRSDLVPARMQLAAALEAENKLDEATKEYQQVAAVQAEYPGLAERQARLLVLQGKKQEAWTLYQKALGQGVATHALELQAASLALDLDHPADAHKLAEAILKEDDRDARAHLVLARAYLAENHSDEASLEARRATTMADLPEAHLVLARVLEVGGKHDQALAEYNLARHPPVEAEASLGRARVMVRMGATRDALTELGELAKNPRLRAQALLLAGDCYADQQQKDKAKKAYEDAFKAQPDSGEVAFKLGRMYLDAGKRKPAADMLDKAVRLGGDKSSWAAEAWLFLGDVRRESRESEGAVKAYKKYLELAPPDASARSEVNKHLAILEGGR
jgi:predicted Zn finger-like uncharacterized protein